MKIASGILLFYTVAAPVASFVGEISQIESEDIFIDLSENADATKYEESAKDAFALGIKRLISSEYSLSEENIEVNILGFDFKNMRAERIKILLRGKGAASDWRAIRDYINGLEIGECEVRVEFGT